MRTLNLKPATIMRETLIIFLSAVAAMIIPFTLITYGVIHAPHLAYALMFWLYAHCYLLLKKYFLKKSLALRTIEFEIINLLLIIYMIILLPIMRDQPDIIQLPACYWTFIFISVYITKRDRRRRL